jgi:hypothetical protein
MFENCQYSPVVCFLRKGNPQVASQNPPRGAAACDDPSPDSKFTLEERLTILDEMELVEGNESNYETSDDDGSIE